VLWDHDWENGDHLDAAPDVARRIRGELGIADEYFVAIPRDPSDAEAERLLAELKAWTQDARRPLWGRPAVAMAAGRGSLASRDPLVLFAVMAAAVVGRLP
jgi:hypothetical protein